MMDRKEVNILCVQECKRVSRNGAKLGTLGAALNCG